MSHKRTKYIVREELVSKPGDHITCYRIILTPEAMAGLTTGKSDLLERTRGGMQELVPSTPKTKFSVKGKYAMLTAFRRLFGYTTPPPIA